jgi:predicted outer membrane repeat protein
MRSGHVEITIVIAHNVAERNGSAIHALKMISATTNNTARVLRVRSGDGW